MIGPPDALSVTPAAPGNAKADDHDPRESDQAEQPGFDPEVEDDVVRVDEVRERVEVGVIGGRHLLKA